MSWGSQSGQSLVAALVVMAIVVSAAGGLAVAVTSLLRTEPHRQAAVAGDLGTQSAVNAAAAWVSTRGGAAAPGSTPCFNGAVVPSTNGEMAGTACLELPVSAPTAARPMVGAAPITWSGACGTADVSAAIPIGHSWFWLTADLPATVQATAWVAGGSSCTPSGPCVKGPLTSDGSALQVAFDCDAGGLGKSAYLHLAAPAVSALTARPPAATVRFGRYGDARPFIDAPGAPLGGMTSPAAVAVADLNGDGLPDLVVVDPGAMSVTVFLNKGGGRFAASWTAGGPAIFDSAPIAVAVADVGGPRGSPDGKPDLVVIRQNDDEVDVFLGKGDGTFLPKAETDLQIPDDDDPGYGISAVAVADFNGDGKPDLALTTTANGANGSLYVLPSKGDGTFQVGSTPYALKGDPRAIVAANFDGQHGPDLAVAEITNPKPNPDQVEVLLNDGTGAFKGASGSPLSVGNGAVALAAGALHGAGTADLAVVNRGDGTVSILLGNGDGTFSTGPNSPLRVGAGPTAVAIGAGPELFVANRDAGTVSVLLGDGAGRFAPLRQGPLTDGQVQVGSRPLGVAAADLNGDGRPDFASADSGAGQVSVKLGNPPPWGSVFLLAARAPTSTSQVEEADVAVRWGATTASPDAALTYEGAV